MVGRNPGCDRPLSPWSCEAVEKHGRHIHLLYKPEQLRGLVNPHRKDGTQNWEAGIVGASVVACVPLSAQGYPCVLDSQDSCFSSALAGVIGAVIRFQQESSLALYLGMATLDNSSGIRHSSKPPRQINVRAKAAMMIAMDRHRKQIPESQRYYDKKRQQGKSHNQAIRALGRHLCRILYTMLTTERRYEIRPVEGDTTGHGAARSVPIGQLRRAKNLARA